MFTGVAMVTTVFKNRSVNFRKPWLPWQRPQWAIWAEEGDIWCMGDIITAILVVIILRVKIPELTMLFSFFKSELRFIFFSRLTSSKNTSVTRKC